jgi:23S rRNA (cytidine1920-2'-O)/16S rRNA (cytidine1409-2'-O)-methyltransferase
MSKRERVDLQLVDRGLVASRQRAQALILAGKVFSGDTRIDKSGQRLPIDAPLDVRKGLPYVGRGGLKLEAGLDQFGVDPAGKKCLDVGASTGGFTDCLLQRGAAAVWSVDVGYGQLDWKLRTDSRVVVLERTNFRTVSEETLPQDFDIAVVDVSFISLRLILPNLKRFLREGAEAVILVKPQFEVGRDMVGKGGIVRDENIRRSALEKFEEHASMEGFKVAGAMDCPVPGADGNVEYLVYLKY